MERDEGWAATQRRERQLIRQVQAIAIRWSWEQACERYDVVWLAQNHGEQISNERWENLNWWLRRIESRPEERTAWSEKFQEDEIMRRIKLDSILGQMGREIDKRLGRDRKNPKARSPWAGMWC